MVTGDKEDKMEDNGADLTLRGQTRLADAPEPV